MARGETRTSNTQWHSRNAAKLQFFWSASTEPDACVRTSICCTETCSGCRFVQL